MEKRDFRARVEMGALASFQGARKDSPTGRAQTLIKGLRARDWVRPASAGGSGLRRVSAHHLVRERFARAQIGPAPRLSAAPD